MDYRKLAIAIFFLVIALIALYGILTMGIKSYYITVVLFCIMISVGFFKQVKKH